MVNYYRAPLDKWCVVRSLKARWATARQPDIGDVGAHTALARSFLTNEIKVEQGSPLQGIRVLAVTGTDEMLHVRTRASVHWILAGHLAGGLHGDISS